MSLDDPEVSRGDRAADYIFDTGSDLGRAQMRYLEELLDASTTDLLDGIVVQPGWRCLELGAGGGSIAQWMAERTAPTGGVVAVDLDTDHLEQASGVEVYRHDINDGLPVAGSFDLIHARLVLLHLPQRLEVLDTLVDALAPGGWLVLGEYGTRLPYGLSAPGGGDQEVFDRVMEIGHNVVGAGAGQSLQWAHQVFAHMEASGLVDVHSREHSRNMVGGDTGSRYLHNLITQIEPLLVRGGITEAELTRCCELLLDLRFRAWFYQFVTTAGRKPVAA